MLQPKHGPVAENFGKRRQGELLLITPTLQELFAAFEEEALSANRHRLLLSVAVALSKNGREDKSTVSKIARWVILFRFI